MEKLTKENFWQPMEELYPDALQLFHEWFTKYKADNNWNHLFNSNSEYQNADGKNAPAPEYYDLPTEFQVGILNRFNTETHNGLIDGAPIDGDLFGCHVQIGNMFGYVNFRLKNKQEK